MSAAPVPTPTPTPSTSDAPLKNEKGAAAASLDEDAGASRQLKLNSKDGKGYTVERKHAFISNLIKTGSLLLTYIHISVCI